MNLHDRSEVEHFVKQLSLGKLSAEDFVVELESLYLEDHEVSAANHAAWFALAAAESRMDLALAEASGVAAEVTRCKRHVEMFDEMTKIMVGKL